MITFFQSNYDEIFLGNCIDISGNKTDKGGMGCDAYKDNHDDCGDYADEDFKSNKMCCECAGGKYGKSIILKYKILISLFSMHRSMKQRLLTNRIEGSVNWYYKFL